MCQHILDEELSNDSTIICTEVVKSFLAQKKVVESDRKRVCRNKSDILCNIKVTTENKKRWLIRYDKQ